MKVDDKVHIPSVAAANYMKIPWEPAGCTDTNPARSDVQGEAGPAVPQVKLFRPLNFSLHKPH